MEAYTDLYNQLICNDRKLLTRVLFVDFNFIENLNKEEMFIHFIGPVLDNSYINGYATYIIYDKQTKKEVESRLYNLWFEEAIPVNISEIKNITNIKNVATICTKRTYQKLKNIGFNSYFFVLQ